MLAPKENDLANKPLILNDGIVLNNETLTQYDEGTWTPSEASKANLTGTPTFSNASYTRIGNTVFARIESITGYTITTAGNDTYLVINSTGLPGVTNSTFFYGSSYAAITASPNELLPVAIADASAGSDTIYVRLITATALGASNGDGVSFVSLFFQYKI